MNCKSETGLYGIQWFSICRFIYFKIRINSKYGCFCIVFILCKEIYISKRSFGIPVLCQLLMDVLKISGIGIFNLNKPLLYHLNKNISSLIRFAKQMKGFRQNCCVRQQRSGNIIQHRSSPLMVAISTDNQCNYGTGIDKNFSTQNLPYIDH